MEGVFIYLVIATWFIFSLLVNVQIKTAVTNENMDVFTITSGQFLLPLIVFVFLCLKEGKNLKLNLSQDNRLFVIVGICFYLGNLFTNFALASVNISSAHVLKATEPIFAVFFNFLFFKKALQTLDLIPLVTICCSVAAFSLQDFTFSKITFTAVFLSNFFLQMRNVLASNLLPQKSNQDSFHSFLVISSVASVLSLIVQAIQSCLLQKNVVILHWHGNVVLLTVALTFFGMHSASYIALGILQPVKHSLFNVFKRGFIIFGSCILLANNNMTHLQFACTILSLFALCQFLNISYLQSKIWLISACAVSIALLIFNAQNLIELDNEYTGPFHERANYSGQNLSHSRQVTFVWHAEFTNQSQAFVRRIEERFPKHDLQILCTYSGTEVCTGMQYVSTKLLVLPELCSNTPLLQWIREHVRNKIAAGPSYREQLLYAISLCTLWSYGGLVITSRTALDHIDRISRINGHFISQDLTSMRIAQKHSPIVLELMMDFTTYYPEPKMHEKFWPLQYAYLENALNIGTQHGIDIVRTNYELSSPIYEEYAALSFDERIKVMSIANVGDEIQTLVPVQFYPYLTTFLDRENLAGYKYARKLTILMNAWLGDDRMRFPNASNFHPILTSIHVSGEWIKKSESVSYLQSQSPIGARDNHTLQILQSLNITSYLSGCATMLLRNPHNERTEKIYAIDVPDDILKRVLPVEIYRRLIVMSHKAWPYIHTPFGRSMKAVNLALKFYAQAQLVITSRLHAAMPCVGLKTPVIFLRTEDLPGGAAGRIDGLDQLWHTYDVSNDAKIAGATELLQRFNWTLPPVNPNAQYALELKKKMLTHIFRESPQFIPVATMFGWIKDGIKDDDI